MINNEFAMINLMIKIMGLFVDIIIIISIINILILGFYNMYLTLNNLVSFFFSVGVIIKI
jgi:hypothetical protein